ncbi:MAG: DUF2490 domain-containing protein [Bacteroidetes bacterium]|nr:DUF2490 domain-containing protein [Bacteroidota bacterium]
MSTEKLLIALSVLVLAGGKVCRGQQEDFQGIVSLGLEKKISSSVSLSLLNEERWNQNLSELGYAFLDGGINYRIDRHWTLGVNYRYMLLRNLDNEYNGRQTLYGDVAYSKGVKRLSFTLRARLQNAWYPLVLNETKQNSVLYNRDKLTLRYRVNYYFVPFINGEIFIPVNHPTHEKIDRYRAAAGFYYNFNDFFKAEVYYQVAHELNQSNKKTNYAIGLGCFYEL